MSHNLTVLIQQIYIHWISRQFAETNHNKYIFKHNIYISTTHYCQNISLELSTDGGWLQIHFHSRKKQQQSYKIIKAIFIPTSLGSLKTKSLCW